METRLGTPRYELGCPTAETTRKLYDEMDFQRAVQAYLWGYPAVSFESIRVVAKRDLGMDSGSVRACSMTSFSLPWYAIGSGQAAAAGG